jgi:hypothetical protein
VITLTRSGSAPSSERYSESSPAMSTPPPGLTQSPRASPDKATCLTESSPPSLIQAGPRVATGPTLAAAAAEQVPKETIVDGKVVGVDGRLDFGELQKRVSPGPGRGPGARVAGDIPSVRPARPGRAGPATGVVVASRAQLTEPMPACRRPLQQVRSHFSSPIQRGFELWTFSHGQPLLTRGKSTRRRRRPATALSMYATLIMASVALVTCHGGTRESTAAAFPAYERERAGCTSRPMDGSNKWVCTIVSRPWNVSRALAWDIEASGWGD